MAEPTSVFNFYFTSNPHHSVGFRLLKIRSEIERLIRFYKEPNHLIDCDIHLESTNDSTTFEYVHTLAVQHLSENLFECCAQCAQLPAFLYAAEFLGPAKAMENIIDNYGGDDWGFEGVPMSEELHKEIIFGEYSKIPLFVVQHECVDI